MLYNLHRLLAGKSPERIVAVEGFSDSMKLHQAGFPAVALMGSSLSEIQEVLLCAKFSRVLLLFDGDEPGQRLSKSA